MAMEFFNGGMEEFMKVNLKIVSLTEKVGSPSQKETLLLGCGEMAKAKV